MMDEVFNPTFDNDKVEFDHLNQVHSMDEQNLPEQGKLEDDVYPETNVELDNLKSYIREIKEAFAEEDPETKQKKMNEVRSRVAVFTQEQKDELRRSLEAKKASGSITVNESSVLEKLTKDSGLEISELGIRTGMDKDQVWRFRDALDGRTGVDVNEIMSKIEANFRKQK